MIIAVPKQKADRSKGGCYSDPISGAMHLKVVLKHVNGFFESSVKLGFAQAVYKSFSSKGYTLSVAPSIEEHRTFVQDDAGRRGKVDGAVNDVDEDWDFEMMVSVAETAASDVCDKLEENQRLCKDKEKAVLTSVPEETKLSRKVTETKRKSAKLIDSVIALKRRLEDV